jgi:D-alanyl-D-alanine dipeptidase
MALDPEARLREIEMTEIPAFFTPVAPYQVRSEASRRHVLNRGMQEKSGRLYCNEDWDFEIPTLEFYAAR